MSLPVLIGRPLGHTSKSTYMVVNKFAKSLPGDHGGGETPVPIPNTEVKPSSADDTAGATLWESRSLPGFFISGNRINGRRCEPPGFSFALLLLP